MLVLITYDVSTQTEAGRKRLRKVAKICQNYGVRVQNSVFECIVDSVQLQMLKASLNEIISPEQDSLRYYNLGKNGRAKVEHVGAKPALDMEDTLIL